MPRLTLTEYSARALKSDRLGRDESALQNLRFGYFGEVGSLLSSIKKVSRDTLLDTERDLVLEEIGDALWYLVAIANLQSTSPTALAAAAEAELRRRFNESDRVLVDQIAFRNIDSLISTQSHTSLPDRKALLGELAATAGSIAEDRRPQANFQDAFTHAEILGRLLALLALTAASFELQLETVANRNLDKIFDRWPGQGAQYHSRFDDGVPEYEQLPRTFTVDFEERVQGKQRHVVQSINGVFVGDRLTDNSVKEDGYRFHDVFHLAYVAHLGWSPVIRGLLKRKRKSQPEIDENQDGARAMIIEEGIATWIFNHAKLRGDFFEGVDRGKLSFSLLKQIRSMVKGYEVDACPLWQWEIAILDGFKVFRDLYKARRGRVHIDMFNHQIVFEGS